MKIVLGLGNPGPRYLLTRHNMGFRVLDKLSAKLKIPLYKVGYRSFYGRGEKGDQEVILAKPMTYMNKSGEAALSLCRLFNISPEHMLVICDDLDLTPGSLRLRPRGGSGGHNGLNSIVDHLNTEDFPRLRIGIGRPDSDFADIAEYVLDEPDAEEGAILERVVELAAEAALSFVHEGLKTTMNRFNRKEA